MCYVSYFFVNFFKNFSGDALALERIAYELCEDMSKDNVIYFEARYSPHILSNLTKNNKCTLESMWVSSSGRVGFIF